MTDLTQEYPAPDLPILSVFNTTDFPQTEASSGGSGGGASNILYGNVSLNGTIENVNANAVSSSIPLPVNARATGTGASMFEVDVYKFVVPAGQVFNFTCSIPVGWEVSGDYTTSQSFSNTLTYTSLKIKRNNYSSGYISAVYASNNVVGRPISGTTGTGAFTLSQYITNLTILDTDNISFGGAYNEDTTYTISIYGGFNSTTIAGGADLKMRINTSVLTTSITNTATTGSPTPVAGTITSATGASGVAINSAITNNYYNSLCKFWKATLEYTGGTYSLTTTPIPTIWTKMLFSTCGSLYQLGTDFTNDLSQLGLTYNTGVFTNSTTENIVLRISASITTTTGAGAIVVNRLWITIGSSNLRLGQSSTYVIASSLGALNSNAIIPVPAGQTFRIMIYSTGTSNFGTSPVEDRATLNIERIL